MKDRVHYVEMSEDSFDDMIRAVEALNRAISGMGIPETLLRGAPIGKQAWPLVLGVPATATSAEVNAAFKRLYAATSDPVRQRELIAARDKARGEGEG